MTTVSEQTPALPFAEGPDPSVEVFAMLVEARRTSDLSRSMKLLAQLRRLGWSVGCTTPRNEGGIR
jgi:hypothetical protein